MAARARVLSWLIIGLVLALGGCRTAPPRAVVGPGADAPWPEQRAALEKLDRYGLDGRVAVAANGDGFTASLRYEQKPAYTNLSLNGPLGIGGLRIALDGEDVRVATSKGEKLDGEAALAELERRLGFALPLSEMRWWLLGIPAPGEANVDAGEAGEIRGFLQNGWRVSIDSRVAGLGFSLPRRLLVEKQDAQRDGARMKLLVERWLP